MTDQGYVKIYRQMKDWEWYSEPDTFRLFFHCLLSANHKDNRYRGVLIRRGTFVTSLDKLSHETGLSVRSVRTSLSRLISTNELTKQSSRQGTIIQVVNWDKYQEATNEATNERQTSDKRATSNKNDNNEKKGNGAVISSVKNGRKTTRWGMVIPTPDEVAAYFTENGYDAAVGREVWKYYAVADWKDAKGDPVRSWKQKARSVWFKPENKARKLNPYRPGG